MKEKNTCLPVIPIDCKILYIDAKLTKTCLLWLMNNIL